MTNNAKDFNITKFNKPLDPVIPALPLERLTGQKRSAQQELLAKSTSATSATSAFATNALARKEKLLLAWQERQMRQNPDIIPSLFEQKLIGERASKQNSR